MMLQAAPPLLLPGHIIDIGSIIASNVAKYALCWTFNTKTATGHLINVAISKSTSFAFREHELVSLAQPPADQHLCRHMTIRCTMVRP